MDTNQTDNKLLYLLLFVILLHILVLIYLLNKEHYTEISIQQKIEQLLEKQQKQPLTPQEEEQLLKWVAGAGAGAQVVFENEDEINETEKKGDAEQQRDTKEKDTPTKQKEKQEQPSKSEPEVEEADEVFATPDSKITAESIAIKMAEKAKHDASTKSLAKDGQESDTQKVSLADITQGFMKKVGERSEHFVNALSTNQGRPTDEQIKIERYISKILKLYGDAEKIHYNKVVDVIKSNKSYKEKVAVSYIGFGLDRNGKITKLFVEKSCGIKELDEMLLFIFKEASSSFPPIPTYIKVNPFEFCIVFTLQLRPDQPNFRFTMN